MRTHRRPKDSICQAVEYKRSTGELREDREMEGGVVVPVFSGRGTELPLLCALADEQPRLFHESAAQGCQ